MILTFFGHRDIAEEDKQDISEKLYCELKSKFTLNPNCICYLGGYGDFDILCAKTVNLLKKEYTNIKSYLIIPYCDEKFLKKLSIVKNYYDEFVFPPLESVPRRYAISLRNRWMVHEANFVVAYVHYSFGGAYEALQYAVKLFKPYVNLDNDKRK